MVKGMNRQVIVVKSPDPRMFEEAIFVLREDCAGRDDAPRVLAEARRAADEYLRRCAVGKKRARGKGRAGERAWAAIVAVSGVIAAGVAWLTMNFVGV